jgi:2-oxoglutarate ferredoxin oxidoreductase subunit beta
MNLDTNFKNTWCPGCSNFGILTAFKEAISYLIEKEGMAPEDFVILSGIGCHGKIVDYLKLNSFYALHGRAIATAQGIKLANPKLKVIVFSGDGDSYDEGLCHLIHSAKRNSDITVIIHNNRTFALTVSQFTATSPLGFKGSSTPEGSIEEPFNPLKLILSSGGTFISRGYAFKVEHLKNLIIEAIKHKGFSFIDVLQPCISFFNLKEFYDKKIYELDGKNLSSKEEALRKIEEWNYEDGEGKIPIGIFYKIEKPTFEEKI